MPAREPRTCVAQVTDESLAGWKAFCGERRINRSQLAEIIGLALGAMVGTELPPLVERWVNDADALRQNRLDRTPPDPNDA